MSKLTLHLSKRIIFYLAVILVFSLWNGVVQPAFSQNTQEQEYKTEEAMINEDLYSLISESDLYCSIFVLDEEYPDLKIIGSEREYERDLMSDGDIIYINKGRQDGLETGQLFLIFEVGPNVKSYGHLAIKRGRARVIDLEEERASAMIEKSCGGVMKGNYLVPFEEKEGFIGKDLGYDIPAHKGEGLKGQVIYLQTDFAQIARNHWAIIDIGEEDDIHLGQQLVLYREIQKGAPLQIFGSLIVIDVQKKTSTIKVLTCKDAVRIGDEVLARTK